MDEEHTWRIHGAEGEEYLIIEDETGDVVIEGQTVAVSP